MIINISDTCWKTLNQKNNRSKSKPGIESLLDSLIQESFPYTFKRCQVKPDKKALLKSIVEKVYKLNNDLVFKKKSKKKIPNPLSTDPGEVKRVKNNIKKNWKADITEETYY